MGRAIDMENDISALKLRVKKVEDVLKEIADTVPKKLHVDLVEDVGVDAENLGSTITAGASAYKMEIKDEKEKTDNEGNDGGSVKPNKRRSGSKKSSDKS